MSGEIDVKLLDLFQSLLSWISSSASDQMPQRGSVAVCFNPCCHGSALQPQPLLTQARPSVVKVSILVVMDQLFSRAHQDSR